MEFDECIIPVTVDITDEDICDIVKEVMRIRKQNLKCRCWCLIDGYNSDSREIYEIPEVKRLCVRLVRSGFCSILNYSPAFEKDEPNYGQLGALEIKLLSEGEFNKEHV